MNVFSLLIPNAEPPVLAEPRQGPFDHPVVPTQLLAGVGALSGDPALNPALGEGCSASRNVVRLVGVKRHGALPGAASGPPNRTSPVDQLLKDGCVVGTGSSDAERQRRAAPVNDNRSTTRWRLVPAFPRSTGFGPGARSPFSQPR